MVCWNWFFFICSWFNLVLDFDFIEEGADQGLPHMEWYGAFSLMVTLVWLYNSLEADKMNTLIFGLLTIISLFIFLKLGKIKASSKQLNRENRQNQNQTLNENADNSKIVEVKPTQISDQSDK